MSDTTTTTTTTAPIVGLTGTAPMPYGYRPLEWRSVGRYPD